MRRSTSTCRQHRPPAICADHAASRSLRRGRAVAAWSIAASTLGGDGLDLDMHEDEPVLVVQVDEVLDRVDVAERDRPGGIEPLPVVKGVAVVAEDRRAVEQLGSVAERHRDVLRQQRSPAPAPTWLM